MPSPMVPPVEPQGILSQRKKNAITYAEVIELSNSDLILILNVPNSAPSKAPDTPFRLPRYRVEVHFLEGQVRHGVTDRLPRAPSKRIDISLSALSRLYTVQHVACANVDH